MKTSPGSHGNASGVETYFAPAARVAKEELRPLVEALTHNPIVDALLKASFGIVAVLDEHRQILAVNDSLLQELGISNGEEVLGLRPGEALSCIHSNEMPGGCGTSKSCESCGAVVSIIASLADEKPQERKCVLSVEKNGARSDMCFRVRSVRLDFQGHPVILLFMQDITYHERWAMLERVFFHDVGSVVTSLQAASALMAREDLEGLRRLTKTEQIHMGKILSMAPTLEEGLKHVEEVATIISKGEAVNIQQFVKPGHVTLVHFHSPEIDYSVKMEAYVSRMVTMYKGQIDYLKIIAPFEGLPVLERYQIDLMPQIWIYDKNAQLLRKLRGEITTRDIDEAVEEAQGTGTTTKPD